MTPIRRRLLNGVGGALLILLLSGAGCQSHTSSEPIGKLSREETIAYLILSDQLTGIRESVKVPLTICISSGTRSEPSAALLTRLIDDSASDDGRLVLKPPSECSSDGGPVVDRSSGRSAQFVYVTESRDPDCGQYLGGWHGGAMYGGGNFYAVEENAGAVSVSRTNCEHFE